MIPSDCQNDYSVKLEREEYEGGDNNHDGNDDDDKLMMVMVTALGKSRDLIQLMEHGLRIPM